MRRSKCNYSIDWTIALFVFAQSFDFFVECFNRYEIEVIFMPFKV